jgi:hypothetical protein
MLTDDPRISGASFKQITFWGGFEIVVDGWYLRLGGQIFHRLFKWDRDYRYIAHRPPTVHDSKGRDLRSVRWLAAEALAKKGILLYHYGLVFPRQVLDKTRYYSSAPWARRASGSEGWAHDAFFGLRRRYRVHNVYQYPSWLDRFHGEHPPQIEALRKDIAAGNVGVAMRPTADIDKLLGSPRYQLGRVCLKALAPFARIAIGVWRWANSRAPLAS